MVREIFKAAPGVEVLVIDDSSPDGTAATVKRLRAQFPKLDLLVRARREGLGKAYLAGFAASLDRVDAVITMDADFSHDPAHLDALVAAGQSHAVVIGRGTPPAAAADGG